MSRALILITLLLCGCTFTLPVKVETRTDTEIAEDENVVTNKRLHEYCVKKCKPFVVLAFMPVDRRCLCRGTP